MERLTFHWCVWGTLAIPGLRNRIRQARGSHRSGAKYPIVLSSKINTSERNLCPEIDNAIQFPKDASLYHFAIYTEFCRICKPSSNQRLFTYPLYICYYPVQPPHQANTQAHSLSSLSFSSSPMAVGLRSIPLTPRSLRLSSSSTVLSPSPKTGLKTLS